MRRAASPASPLARLLAACLLALAATLPLNAWAVDTDGDGVDDSVDAFPTYPEATTDTDGDGKPDVLNNLLFSDSFDGVAASGWTGIVTALPLTGGWILDNSKAHTGSGSLAGYATGGGAKSVSRTVTVPAQGGYISYWHLKYLGCSSSVNCGFNAYTNSLMTSTVWVKSTYTLSAGVNTLTWMVKCGGSFGSYRCGYLDDIEVRSNSSLVEDDDDDGDGVPDLFDAFPLSAAAAVDADQDGFADAWLEPNPYNCIPSASTCNGLTLDPAPPALPLDGSYKGSSVKDGVQGPRGK